MYRAILVVLFSATVFSQKAKIGIVEQDIKAVDGSEIENEFISVELKKPNEDIKFVAQVRLHLKDGHVHVNNHPLGHNHVHSIQMMVLITDIVNGVQQAPQRKSVELRVLIQETNLNGDQRLFVEEEFVAIGQTTVEQIDVQQIVWESNVRKSITVVRLTESQIHKKPRVKDHKMFIADEQTAPHLPNHGLEGEDHHFCRHHHRHHHHHHGNGSYVSQQYSKAKCWYHHLSWKAKVALFALGFFGLLTAVVCCGLCAKRRRHHRALNISAPMDDTVAVDVDDTVKSPKKNADGKYEFHFEFDNTVVVDDKKNLMEEA